jgi:hypothetical protein
MGALAAARSTESSLTQLAARENVADLYVLDGYYNPSAGLTSGYDPGLLRTIERLPHVRDVRSEVGLSAGPVSPQGKIPAAALGLSSYGSVDGLGFTEGRAFVLQGRMPNPRSANEFVTDPTTARLLGLHVGQSVRFGFLTNAQSLNLTGSAIVPAGQRFRATLVGLATTPFMNLFQDQNSAGSSQELLFTPALTRRLRQCCANDMISGIQLRGGGRYDTAVEAELRKVLPRGVPFTVVTAASKEATAQLTLRPDAIALDVFGGIAALALLLIAGQVITRRASSRVGELAVLRALGAGRTMTAADNLVGSTGAVVLGSLGALVVAVGLSPLAPLGPVRPYLPAQLRFDWVVLGPGVALIALVLCALAGAAALRWAPQRDVSRARRTRAVGPRSLARNPVVGALPLSAATGLRFALEPGSGRNRVPVRSAVLGAALAMLVVTGNVTFAASMSSLVSHPALFGWNWDFQIDGGGGLGDIPQRQAAQLLNADPDVKAWTGLYFSALRLDGVSVPVMGGTPHASFGPPILSGHGFDGADQVVLGTETLAALHKSVGDTVSVTSSSGATSRLTIVGTATMPSIGVVGSTHLEMGSGALLSYRLIPPSSRNVFDSPRPGPNAILVRLAPGVSRAAGLRSLQHIARTLQLGSSGGSILGVQRPAEILNYGTLGRTPQLLGGALAGGAVIGLAMTLVTLVRRRRRDLALLKTLGFTRRQLGATIAWQATVDVALGCLVGVPLGALAGRYLWILFARGIYAVPSPVIPVGTVLLAALAALVLANLAAAVPARLAARTPTALLLRAE